MNLLRNIRQRKNSDAYAEAFVLNAPVSGRIVPLSEVSDPTFSEHILGSGFAILPESGTFTAPADAVIEAVPRTCHAISMTTDSGAELLIHVGLDTVELDGKYFNIPVAAGDRVKAGDVLIEADLDGIRKAGYDIVTPVVVTNTDAYTSVTAAANTVEAGLPFLILTPKSK